MQRGLEVVCRGERVVFEGLHAFATMLLMENFELEESEAQRSGTHTRVTFRPTTPTCSLADAVYNSNRRVANDAGDCGFDASRVLVRADAEDGTYIPGSRPTNGSTASLTSST